MFIVVIMLIKHFFSAEFAFFIVDY